MGRHRWSGWPGAICEYCGAEDPLEIALADSVYDPITREWSDKEREKEAKELFDNCPLTEDGEDPFKISKEILEERIDKLKESN